MQAMLYCTFYSLSTTPCHFVSVFKFTQVPLLWSDPTKYSKQSCVSQNVHQNSFERKKQLQKAEVIIRTPFEADEVFKQMEVGLPITSMPSQLHIMISLSAELFFQLRRVPLEMGTKQNIRIYHRGLVQSVGPSKIKIKVKQRGHILSLLLAEVI